MPGRVDEKIRCSFCGKTQDQVRKLIAGNNNVFICDECIDLCSEILEEELPLRASEILICTNRRRSRHFWMNTSSDRTKQRKYCLWPSIITTRELLPLKKWMWMYRRVIS